MRAALLLLIFPVLFSAQDKTLDSLKLALKSAKHDTERCNLLSALAETAGDEEWPKFNAELKRLAETNLANNTEPKNFFLNHLSTALNNIGFIYQNQGDVTKALDWHTKCLKIKIEIGEKNGIAASLNNIGVIYKDQGDIQKALEYFKKSLKIREEIGDKEGIAGSLNNIGTIYDNQGNIPMALDYYDKGLKIRQKIGDKKGIAGSLNNIGFIYKNQGDFPKALECYVKSLKIQEEIGDKMGIANSLNNIGVIYQYQGDPSVTSSREDALRAGIPKALEYFDRSLKTQEEIGDKMGIAISLNNIGGIYNSKNDIPKALEYFGKSLKIQEEIGDKEGIATSLNNIGVIYMKQKNYNKAMIFCTQSLQASREIGYPENIKKAAKYLNEIYKATGNYKLAFENYELFIQMRDSINNDATKKASIKHQLKYEYEKRAAADSVKNAEAQKVKDAQLQAQAASLKQEKTQRYALYGGLVLVAGFLIFVFNRFRVTNKQKKIIEEQKVVVDEAFEKLAEKNKEVLDSIQYAKRIQIALLPNEKYIDRKLQELKS